jgi:CRISPR-associated endonuclease/helicase Cas3
MINPLAHIALDADGTRRDHLLVDHLYAVATLAAQFASVFDCAPVAHTAGLWHDLGKYRPGFQEYIASAHDIDAHIEHRVAGANKTHSAAGALHAAQVLAVTPRSPGALLARALTFVIAGHHAGLGDWHGGLASRLFGSGKEAADREYREAQAKADAAVLAVPAPLDAMAALRAIPGLAAKHPLAASLWVRMLFSALVDADFLDTDAFMNPARFTSRAGFPPLSNYLAKLDAHLNAKRAQAERDGRAHDPVMVERDRVLQQCRAKAALAPGVFTLTVPTGGGKTLSSLAFALTHAVAHQRRRVIYAIPYTSIIEQTADIFGAIFGAENLVEHHSQFDGEPTRETHRSRLACENWDAPLVVTTNVQLFESLFAARTSRCRKLHNIAGSVIVLDEAQLLPPAFLQPILDVLRLLVEHYGVTLVLCTATQPALTDLRRFDGRGDVPGLPLATEIVDDRDRLYAALERVQVHWPDDLLAPAVVTDLAARLAREDCVLAIVATRAAAVELVHAIDRETGDHETVHLSASMCGAHRSAVIAQVRDRLKARQDGRDPRPLRVVSTTLVEAGVDVDFPVVYRALAGLDSIAQAAGRCNREGRMLRGHVHVFVAPIPRPLTTVARGAESTRSVLATQPANVLAPASFENYFRRFYGQLDLDAKQISSRLKEGAVTLEIAFRSVADDFRLVEDEAVVSVIVPYAGLSEAMLDMLQHGRVDRWLMRKAQRYMVNVRRDVAQRWLASGDIDEPVSGIHVLRTDTLYHPRLGLAAGSDAFNPEGYAS